MPPRCDALGARSAIDAHNVAPRYFSEDAIPRQVRLGQYNLIGLGLDPPAISCSSAKWRRPRTAFLPRVEIGCLDTRIQRYLKKTRGALGRAAIELIGIFEGQHPPCQRQVSLSRLLPLVANGCIELSNVKRPPVIVRRSSGKRISPAKLRKAGTASRQETARRYRSSIERVHHSNLTGINDRTRAAKPSAMSIHAQSGNRK